MQNQNTQSKNSKKNTTLEQQFKKSKHNKKYLTLKQSINQLDSEFEYGIQNVHEMVFKRFQNFAVDQKINKLHKALKQHYGRHNPIQYRPQYEFSQYWQGMNLKSYNLNNIQYIKYSHWKYYFVSFIILISILWLTWAISIKRLFQNQKNQDKLLSIFGVFIVILDVILRYCLLKDNQSIFHGRNLFIVYLQFFWKDIIILIYFSTIPLHFKNIGMQFFPIDLIIILFFINRCQQIKAAFKIQIIATPYKNLFNILQLFSTLLSIAHFFALSLYWISLTCQAQQNNWIKDNKLSHLQPIEKYLYSLYFALTTMVTVGYGDLHPVNTKQILVIIIVQLVGIVNYGYFVNQIGHILSTARKQDQILAYDISNLSKMAKYYKIDQSIIDKAKNFLICKKNETIPFTTQQQQSTLSKLNDYLRDKIILQNSLKILKSSLFYVCFWTKNFQLQIAKKIHKKIFSPNQQIIQIPGNQRIYIFKRGLVEIHANRSSGYKQHFKKILRKIHVKQSLQVSDNIYGYSFIMSNTPIRLAAINKQFVVAFYVEKKDFLAAVMESPIDIEYYSQMKSKIDQYPYPQSWQAPLILNTKEHYIPNIQYVIRKNKTLNKQKLNFRTLRVQPRRFRPRYKRAYFFSMQQIDDEVAYQTLKDSIAEVYQYVKRNLTYQSQKDLRIRSKRSVVHLQPVEVRTSIIYQKQVFEALRAGGILNQEINKQNLPSYFQQAKQYTIYFKKSNKKAILDRYQNSNFNLKQTYFA